MPYYPPATTSGTGTSVADVGISVSNSDTANLAAWNALMAVIPDNSTVYFPPSPNVYSFSGTLAIPAGKHLRIQGSSNQKSIIQTTSATADIFTVNDWYNEFSGLKFVSSVTRTAGAAINSGNNVAICVYNCDFNGMWDGIVYTGGVNAGNLAVVSQCNWTATLNRGIVLDGTNANTIMDTLVMDGTAGVQNVCLEVLQCGSLVVSNCDFIRAKNNLRFNPTSPNGCFSAYFVNTFFDTSSASSVKFQGTGNIQRVKFVNCWFSGSVTGCEFASTATTLPTAIDFVACDIFGNSGYGILATAVQDFSVASSRIAGNATAGISVSAAAGSVTKVNLSTNTVGPTAGFGGNGQGIVLNAGTYGAVYIAGNLIAGNTSNLNVVDNSTVATPDLKQVVNNPGRLLQGLMSSFIGPVSTSGTAETLLHSTRIPANAAIAGQAMRIRMYGVSSSTGALVFRVRVGTAGTTADAQAWVSATSAAQAANAHAGIDVQLLVRTNGATGTVMVDGAGTAGGAVLSTATAAAATATVNTTTPWFITVTASMSLGTFGAQTLAVEIL